MTLSPPADRALPLSGPSDVGTLGRSDGLDLSVIIVNWNTRDLLADCLQSVYDTVQDLSFEVFVVDNASSDGSAAMVREQFPEVRLIENSENVGFARANNQAIRESTGEYVLLLNPDTVVHNDAILVMLEALEVSPSVGALGAQLVAPDGSLFALTERFPTLLSELPLLRKLGAACQKGDQRISDTDESTSLRYGDWISGACMMMRGATLAQIGSLDEAFWLYGEELEWCWRARSVGWTIAAIPGARVTHFVQASSHQNPALSSVSFVRGRGLFYRKARGRLQEVAYWGLAMLRSCAWLARIRLSPRKEWWGMSPSKIRQSHRAVLSEGARRIAGKYARPQVGGFR